MIGHISPVNEGGKSMKRALLFVAVVVLAGAGNASAQELAGQFRACIRCHQPPDLKFPTDRAWLDQINRTS